MIELKGDVCYVGGDIMIDTIPALLKEIRPLIQAGVNTLDCSAVHDVDSSALGFLLACEREAQQQHHALNIVQLPANLLSLASLYGIVDQLAA
jgi:phospholipid transport system transporter-binding protein